MTNTKLRLNNIRNMCNTAQIETKPGREGMIFKSGHKNARTHHHMTWHTDNTHTSLRFKKSYLFHPCWLWYLPRLHSEIIHKKAGIWKNTSKSSCRHYSFYPGFLKQFKMSREILFYCGTILVNNLHQRVLHKSI